MTPLPHFPTWLHGLAVASLFVALGCAVLIAVDEHRRPQAMWIMNLVWPLTALFGSLLWLTFYMRFGREKLAKRNIDRTNHGGHAPAKETPMWVAVAKGASHCGAGCTLGDLVAEWLAFGAPAVAVALGWRSIFADKMFAVWVLDYLVAFAFGIAFQYFTLKPMRKLSVAATLVQALKADVASITAWQVGMYGFMAVAQFAWFRPLYGAVAPVNSPEFWLAMQLAMLCGFLTSYPVNWLLVAVGVKEKM